MASTDPLNLDEEHRAMSWALHHGKDLLCRKEDEYSYHSLYLLSPAVALGELGDHIDGRAIPVRQSIHALDNIAHGGNALCPSAWHVVKSNDGKHIGFRNRQTGRYLGATESSNLAVTATEFSDWQRFMVRYYDNDKTFVMAMWYKGDLWHVVKPGDRANGFGYLKLTRDVDEGDRFHLERPIQVAGAN